jgi:hypothetical protein
MAILYSQETAGFAVKPIVKPSGGGYGARLRRFRSTINLAAVTTANGIATQAGIPTTDWVQLVILPAGYTFAFGIITASVTLSTAVVAIGTNPTHGSNGQYRAAATYTAVDTPTFFGLAAAVGGAALTADTPVYLTVATAAVPSSGTLVIDLYVSGP